MQNRKWTKKLVLGIIMLFIGASVVPNMSIKNITADSIFNTRTTTKNILIYITYDGGSGYPKSNFDTDVINILNNAGYSVTVTDRVTTPNIDASLLSSYGQLWLVQGDLDVTGCFLPAEIDSIFNFKNAGNGLLLMTDHSAYQCDINQIANQLGVSFYGTLSCSGLITPTFTAHPLSNGVSTIISSTDDGIINPGSSATVVATYLGYNLIAIKDDGTGRVVFDAAWVRIEDNYILMGDTSKYVVNVADWLAGSSGVNHNPNMPSNPSPANHVTGIDINADLSWTGGDPDSGDTVTYDIYFGTSSNPPLKKSGHTSTNYDVGTMNPNTQYFWKIVAKDNHGASTNGPIWYFSTTINQVTLTMGSCTGGTTDPASAGIYIYSKGTSVTITATANSGYHFTGWTGTYAGSTNPYTFTINTNCQQTAHFAEDEPFYFIHITDVHAGDSGWARDYWGPALEQINAMKHMNQRPAFVVVTGDIVDQGDKLFHDEFDHIIKPFQNDKDRPYLKGGKILSGGGGGWYIAPYDIPIYFCPGNHDAYGPRWNRGGFTNYQDHLADSYYHRIETHYGKTIDIFSLNSGQDETDAWPADTHPRGDGLLDIYGKEVKQFPEDLAASTGDIKIVLTHHPYSFKGTTEWDDWVFVNNIDIFFKNCIKYHVDLLLCGHLHYSYVDYLGGNSLPTWRFSPGGDTHVQIIGDNFYSTLGDAEGNYRIIEVLSNGDINIKFESQFQFNPSSCLPAGTKITMTDGHIKNIEDVKVGDKVLSYDTEKNMFTNWTVRVTERRDNYSYYEINDGLICLSNAHPLYIKKQDGRAGWGSVMKLEKNIMRFSSEPLQIEVGDQLFTINQEWITVNNITYHPESTKLYNILSYTGNKNYFANGILVYEDYIKLSYIIKQIFKTSSNPFMDIVKFFKEGNYKFLP